MLRIMIVLIFLTACGGTHGHQFIYELHSPYLRGSVHVINRELGWELLYNNFAGEAALVDGERGRDAAGNEAVFFRIPSDGYREELVLIVLPTQGVGYERKRRNSEFTGPYFELVLKSSVPLSARKKTSH